MTPFRKKRKIIYSATLLFSTLLLFQGCSDFSHLTATDSANSTGPSANSCGNCHVEQYREWQGSVHNLAYTDPIFREATDEYDDDSCLACHVPASVHAKELSARSYNLHEGVSCVACHLDAGAMYGPHASSALANPHPVAADPSFYTSSSLCGVCHEETFATWQESVQKRRGTSKIRACPQCHMAEVTRTSTKGTNIFSRLLVSFEKKHTVRSHTIALTNMANFADAVQIRSESTRKSSLHIQITNQLPHNLPGSEYTKSTVVLVVSPKDGRTKSLSTKLVLSDTDTPLAPGENKQIFLNFDNSHAPLRPQTEYTIQLVVKQPGKPSSLQLAITHFITESINGRTQ